MKLCDYGCGQEAKYQFKNGKWCCSTHYLKCPIYRKKREKEGNPFYNKTHTNEYKDNLKKIMMGKKMPRFCVLKNNTTIFCKFGCGRLAKYISKQGEYYCENNASKCPIIIKINRCKNLGSKNSKRQAFKKIKGVDDNILCDYGCGKIAKYVNKNEKYCCSKYITQCRNSMSLKKSRYYISDYQEKYPLFYKIEEMRYNPDKPGEKEIQVHCKNHKCKNSKEKGGWFTPTKGQLYERCRNIEKFNMDHSYFYCSDKCKNECPLYRSKGADPFKEIDLPYTQEEIQLWKETVLKQDNYKCQKCGSKENLHCHHIVPIKENELLALDPDNGIVLCQDCHYEIGHKTGTECSTGNLANKSCQQTRRIK